MKLKQRKIHNRLLELIQERERKMGRRFRQRDLAEFVGVSDHTISNWIRNDTSRFEAQTLERLCDYFDCDISDLLYFEYIEVDLDDVIDS